MYVAGKCGYGGATVNVTLCNGWFTGWVLSVAGKCGNGGPTGHPGERPPGAGEERRHPGEIPHAFCQPSLL